MVLRGVQARQRAEAAFARLRAWDTEANNGVLIYLLLADHRLEIVADRGLNGLRQRRTVAWRLPADGRAPAGRANRNRR